MRTWTLVFVGVFAGHSLHAAHDRERANGYDDAWEWDWVNHARTIYNQGANKTAGFVLQIGDSITHSNPYSQWPRYGNGKTSEDSALILWARYRQNDMGSGNADTSNKNGMYLAIADTSGQRGMTASSGIDTAEFLSGSGNGGTTMPFDGTQSSAKTKVGDGSAYSGNLHIGTLASAFRDAPFAVLMLGTNDASGNRSADDFLANLTALVDSLEARQIVVVLSTIPPHHSKLALAQAYNARIRAFAQTRGLPLIDFYAEVLARRPGTSWNGTLMGSNDVHPSASGGGYSSSSDPYADGGDAASHATGPACEHVGYLLRSWLTIQKLKEVKRYIADGVDPNTAPAIESAPAASPNPVSLP